MQRNTTTIQVSQKTKKLLEEVKEKEQLSNFDAVVRFVLLNYKLLNYLESKGTKKIPIDDIIAKVKSFFPDLDY